MIAFQNGTEDSLELEPLESIWRRCVHNMVERMHGVEVATVKRQQNTATMRLTKTAERRDDAANENP